MNLFKNLLHESMLHIYYILAAQKLYTQHFLYSLSYVTTANCMIYVLFHDRKPIPSP